MSQKLVMTSSIRLSVQKDQDRFQGFVEVLGHKLYVDYEKPKPGRPVVVLLNGLTYRTALWDTFVDTLRGDGLGILRYDPIGMGQTLFEYGPITSKIELMDQVEDLRSLLYKLGIEKPHLVGLSYGGGVAFAFAGEYPEKVGSIITMAQLVAPVESHEAFIRTQVSWTRIMFPFNPSTDEQLYNHFLKQLAYAVYPHTDPIVLEHPYKLEATYRLAEGVKDFYAVSVVNKLPICSVHMMIARKDKYLPNSVHDNLWSALPANVRASRLYIRDSEHKIPESAPILSASWVKAIVNKVDGLFDGKSYEATPATGQIIALD